MIGDYEEYPALAAAHFLPPDEKKAVDAAIEKMASDDKNFARQLSAAKRQAGKQLARHVADLCRLANRGIE